MAGVERAGFLVWFCLLNPLLGFSLIKWADGWGSTNFTAVAGQPGAQRLSCALRMKGIT